MADPFLLSAAAPPLAARLPADRLRSRALVGSGLVGAVQRISCPLKCPTSSALYPCPPLAGVVAGILGIPVSVGRHRCWRQFLAPPQRPTSAAEGSRVVGEAATVQPKRPASAVLYPCPPGFPSAARIGGLQCGSNPSADGRSLSWALPHLCFPPRPVAGPLHLVVLDPPLAVASPDPWCCLDRRPRSFVPRLNCLSYSCPRMGMRQSSSPPLCLGSRGWPAGSRPRGVAPSVESASTLMMRLGTRGRGGVRRSGNTPSFDVSLVEVADAPAQAAENAALLLLQNSPRL